MTTWTLNRPCDFMEQRTKETRSPSLEVYFVLLECLVMPGAIAPALNNQGQPHGFFFSLQDRIRNGVHPWNKLTLVCNLSSLAEKKVCILLCTMYNVTRTLISPNKYLSKSTWFSFTLSAQCRPLDHLCAILQFENSPIPYCALAKIFHHNSLLSTLYQPWFP